jgi:molybdate/tungstate transport system substrate-binding protein
MVLIGLAPGLAAAAGPVNVLYAGSLVNLMERSVGPAFDRASGERLRGYAGGSVLLANQIKDRLRQADVFISAAPAVNARLMGAANGRWERWYVTFAESALLLGYDPRSRFAAAFRSRPWYKVLQSRGIRLGRTDPKLDPKGAQTLALMRRAQAYYRIPDLARRVLGAPENPAQVLPEEVLVGRLQSGELDAGFFYSTETSAARIPTVRLPPAITPKALYTIAILRDAPHPRGAQAFVSFLLGPQGRRLMMEHGLAMRPPALTGNASAVPAALRSVLGQ